MGDKLRVPSVQPGDSFSRCGKVDEVGITSIELFKTYSVATAAFSSLFHKCTDPTTATTIFYI